MGRDLVKRYPVDKMGVRNLIAFAADLYRSGKVRESLSFAVWELCYRTGIFSRRNRLKLNDGPVLRLQGPGIGSTEFDKRIAEYFHGKGLSIVRSSHDWKRIFIDGRGNLYGYVEHDDNNLFKCRAGTEFLEHVGGFVEKIKSIFVSRSGTVFVSVRGALYRGSDGGGDFQKVLTLSSSDSFIRHNYAITETPDGTLVLGEYGNVWEHDRWRNLAYLYFSSDNGLSWRRTDFLIRRGVNKHVHMIHYSRGLDRLLLADGDNKKQLWVSDPAGCFSMDRIRWRLRTNWHIQTGGYTSIVECDGKILFGTDYQGGTNFLVETNDARKLAKKVVPDPYRRSPIHTLLLRQSKKGQEIWANLPVSIGRSRSLLMYTGDQAGTWNRVIEYDSRAHGVSLISAAGTVMSEVYCAISDKLDGHRVVYKVADY